MTTFNPKVEIPDNLKRIRREKGFKQKDVAEATGIDNSTLSKFESGARQPDWDDLITLCNFYGVSFSEMVGGEKTREQPQEQIVDEETKRIMNLLNSLSDSERETALAMLFGLEYKLRYEQSIKARTR